MSPLTRSKEQDKKARSPSEADFDRWWSVYPRKRAKKAAREAYGDAVKEIAAKDSGDIQAAIEKLHQAAQTFARSPEGQAGYYCPHPATWLNSGRYYDEDEDAAHRNGDIAPDPVLTDDDE